MIPNLTLSNPSIKSYFDGTGTYIPVSEFMYIHTHPLIKPNFLEEIEVEINEVASYIKTKKIAGMPGVKLAELAKKLAVGLQNLSQETAPEVLETLREVYSYISNFRNSLSF